MESTIVSIAIFAGIYYLITRKFLDYYLARLYKIYPLLYIKKLEKYFDITRNLVLLYDESDHDPRMAAIALEAMRRNLFELNKELVEPTDAEKVNVADAIKKFRRFS